LYTRRQRIAFAVLVVSVAGVAYLLADVLVTSRWLVAAYVLGAAFAFRGVIVAVEAIRPARTLKAFSLLRALRVGQITLHYQPIIDLPSGSVSAVEGLARWAHPRLGLRAPGEWLDGTDHPWVNHRFNLLVLDIAIRQASAWRAQGRALRVNVNLAPKCLCDPDLPPRIRELLDHHELPGSLLGIEITEQALDLGEVAERNLRILAAMDIVLALDDFGIGHSSLYRLTRVRPDHLKIDRSFVIGMSQDRRNRVMVETATGLGHNLDLAVVAEGVETEAALEEIKAIGCDAAQGFVFSPALPAAELVRWVDAHSASDTPKAVSGRPAPVTRLHAS
jgi:EAL domain-containing protein (putative c-di-GMP-specific phosphodiesterase class I)